MKKKIAVLVAAFVLIYSEGSAQGSINLTQNIRGKVIDASSRAELIGASVRIVDSNSITGSITDVYGDFTLKDIFVGRVSLIESLKDIDEVITMIQEPAIG